MKMRGGLLFLGAAAVPLLNQRAAAHPSCYYDDRAPDPEIEMTFCPQQEEGACCNDQEEEFARGLFLDASAEELTGDCATYYKEIVCGSCNSYAGHLYERLGSELGAADGMTMKSAFCLALIEACEGQLTFPTYDGMSYCDKHVGESDQLWSYPIDPEVLTFVSDGLVDAFPDLPDSDLPVNLIAMHMTPAGDEWWLAGQDGEIKKVDVEDPTSATTVVDLNSGMELLKAFEEGLLDFTFSPAFNSNNYFYVSYTVEDDEGSKNRLSRFTYAEGDPTATKSSVDIVLTSEIKAVDIHTGGWVGFRPSDYQNPSASLHDIYWAIGDGGPQEDPYAIGADVDNLLATVVRVRVPSAVAETGYEIPDGNREGGRGEICANGFRNPFRCAFDSATDELYCADVGHTMVEEIDLVQCGKDYGWSRFEGSRCQEAAEDLYGDCESAVRTGFTFPIFQYCHTDYSSTAEGEDEFTAGQDICGTRSVVGSSVIAGNVYYGQRFSDVLEGALLFADYQSKNIYYLKKEGDKWATGTIISDGAAQVISFAQDNNGEQYIITSERKAYQLPCGDLCSSTCLEQDSSQLEMTSLGCFADVMDDRALELIMVPECDPGDDIMSPEICASYCATIEGAVYFGVQFAYECFCGAEGDNYDRHGALDESSCSTPCVGNLDKTCGGFDAIEVFSFERVDPIVDSTSTDDYSYLGCYGDSSASRVLSGAFTRSSEMTAELCSSLCQDSLFFGTQFSNECFCSAVGDDYDAYGSATCNKACAGDESEICGGKYAISIYENANDSGPAPSPSSDDDPYVFVGCFSDSRTNRLLGDDYVSGPSMTTEFCASFCEGSAFFGTEYSTQCFCGSPASLGTHEATDCIMACSGDSSETCGGVYAISVYEYTDTQGAGNYLGCFSDSKGIRVMTDMSVDLAMTPEVCASHCAEYIYYGTQYGKECWCSNTNDFESLGESSACTMPCAGDPSETCGGYAALSVYEQ